MTQEQIIVKIKDIYNTEKGKGFISHLLRSFFPVNKAKYVLDDENDGIPKVLKCCITGVQVYSRNSILQTMLQNSHDLFREIIEFIRVNNQEGEIVPLSESVSNNIREKLSTMPLAVVSDESDKVLSESAFHALQEFYFTELINGNKHINWIANNEIAKWITKSAKRDGFNLTNKEEKVIHKAIEHSKMSLGELDTFKDLIKKFKSNKDTDAN